MKEKTYFLLTQIPLWLQLYVHDNYFSYVTSANRDVLTSTVLELYHLKRDHSQYDRESSTSPQTLMPGSDKLFLLTCHWPKQVMQANSGVEENSLLCF